MAELPRGELIRAFASLAVTLLVMLALLFGAAGTLQWAHGWWFMAVFVVLILISMAALWRLNPEIFVARARPTGAGSQGLGPPFADCPAARVRRNHARRRAR